VPTNNLRSRSLDDVSLKECAKIYFLNKMRSVYKRVVGNMFKSMIIVRVFQTKLIERNSDVWQVYQVYQKTTYVFIK
jgi:hypothetical protein